MAIYIDIIARLNEQRLIKQGEELRRYINGLEEEIRETRIRAERGATRALVKLDDAVATSRDKAVNATDDLTRAYGRRERATRSLNEALTRTVRTEEDVEKQTKDIEKAIQELADAEQNLVYKLQAENQALRANELAKRNLNEETKAYNKNLRDVAKITDKNRGKFIRLSMATNRLRRDAENLHASNITILRDNKSIAKSMEGLSDATKKVAWEREKYNEVLLSKNPARIKAQGKVVQNAIEAEGRKARDVTAVMVELIQQHREHGLVVSQNENSLRRLANQSLQLEQRSADLRYVNRDVIDQNVTLIKQFDRVDESVKKVTREYRKYYEMSQDGSVSSAALAGQIEKINEAFVSQQRAARDASFALDDYYKRQAEGEKRAEEAAKRAEEAARLKRQRAKERFLAGRQTVGQYAARNIGALTPLGTLSPTTLLPLAAIIGTVGEAVVTASQAIAVLPAAATAAAAGIGTLTVGMWGFGDALGSMDDPKKFAEALYTLAPNAQQAALSLKNLVDGPLGDLKRATQDALFANVSPTLQSLAQTFGPMMQRMMTSIATSFNQMFTGISFEFMTPEMQQRVGTITTNISTMFDRIRPGVSAFVSAFTKITETGSGLLPRLADGFSRAMISFDNFITRTQEDGSLQEFMLKGIDAVSALSKWLLEFGQDIYKVFGNKSPEEFMNTLYGLKSVIMGLANLFTALARIMDEWGPIIGGIVEDLGGMENILYGLISYGVVSWGVKLFKVFKELKGIIKPTAAAFGSVGPAASAAAATTTTAFANAGTNAGKGFASNIGTALKNFSWNAVGLSVGAAIAVPILDGLDRKFNEWIASKQGNPQQYMDQYNKKQDENIFPLAFPILGALEDIIRNGPGGIWADDDPPPSAPKPPSTDSFYERMYPAGETPASPPVPDIPPSYQFPLPDVPIDPETGKALTDSEIMNKLRGELPRESYAVDPFTDPVTGQKITPMLPMGPNGMPEYPTGGTPGTPSIQGPVMPQYNSFGQFTGYGANMVDPEEVFDAQLAVVDKAGDLEEANKDLLAAKQSGLLSEEEIHDLERKVLDGRLSLHKALVQMGKAQAGDVEKLKTETEKAGDALGEFGAEIDKDFGISKGLTGIAENITKFLANLAFAPAFGAIRGAQAALGFPQGEGVGSGLTGMAASAMGYHKGGALDPDAEKQTQVPVSQAPGRTPGYSPNWYRGGALDAPVSPPRANLSASSSSSTEAYTGGKQRVAGASGLSSIPELRLNPNNVSTAGLKPQSMALLSLIQGMPQFANVPLTSAYRPPGNPADRLPGGGMIPWHPNGQGLDFGLNANNPAESALGDQLKAFLEANKELFGVNHVLWKTMEGGNHYDHVHVGLNGSGNGRPDTSPLLQALTRGGPLRIAGANANLTSLSSGIPIPLPVTIVGGSGAAGIMPPGIVPPPAPAPATQMGPPVPGAGKPASNAPLSVPPAGTPGGRPGSTGSMKDGAVTKVWTVNPDGSISWRSSYGNPTAAPKGQPGSPATTPPTASSGNPPSVTAPSVLPPGLQPRLPRYANGGEVPIMAHSGEHVLTREDVAAIGGQAAVYNFRRSLHRYQTGGAVQPSDLGGLLGVGDAPPPPPPPPPPPRPAAPPKPPAAPAAPTPPASAAAAPLGPPLAAEAPELPVPPAQPAQLPETVLPGGVETQGSVIGAQVQAPEGYGQGFAMTGGGLLGAAQGAIQTAIQAGGLAGDMAGGMGGGSAGAAVASAALQIAMEQINRAIEYGGQVVGIAGQGILETFLPAGGSELAQNNWATRWLGGIAGAAPAIANLAGGAGATNQRTLAGVGGPPTPEQIAAQGMDPNRSQHTGAGAPAGPYTGVNIENYVVAANEDRAGQDLARYQPAPGMR